MSLLAHLALTPQQSAFSDADFQQLRELIYQTTGIFFQENKRYLLESCVGRRLSLIHI
jgi:chemotaxis protein methyltransferase CheR